MKFANHEGPVWEIHAGSGYWSQDLAIHVLATPKPPQSVEVRWPDGHQTTTPIPPHAAEIEIDKDGVLQNVCERWS
ncbi:MAG: hypothetical protein MK179_20460 [Pirellulaceae bacterium]|nr:hypothetical protein [Pirellulaceae bacterium]